MRSRIVGRQLSLRPATKCRDALRAVLSIERQIRRPACTLPTPRSLESPTASAPSQVRNSSEMISRSALGVAVVPFSNADTVRRRAIGALEPSSPASVRGRTAGSRFKPRPQRISGKRQTLCIREYGGRAASRCGSSLQQFLPQRAPGSPSRSRVDHCSRSSHSSSIRSKEGGVPVSSCPRRSQRRG